MYVFIYGCIYLCVSRLLAKRKMIQTWNFAHILVLTLSKNEFFVFSKKSPWRPLTSKNYRITWIFRISPPKPCFIFHTFSKVEIYLWVWTWQKKIIYVITPNRLSNACDSFIVITLIFFTFNFIFMFIFPIFSNLERGIILNVYNHA